MKTLPTEPGIYLHLGVSRIENQVGSRYYILKVLENGCFWHPSSLTPEDIRGSFIRIPDEMKEQALVEASEVFVEEKAKDILRLSWYDRERYLSSVEDPKLRELVKARVEELSPGWRW